MINSAEIESRVFVKGRNITQIPINLDEVAYKLTLNKPVQIFYVENMPNEIGAYTRETADYYYILVNSNHPPRRQRFSAAHEIAHLHLGHSDISIHSWNDDSIHNRYQELEADQFAAGLLMPADWMYNLANSYSKDMPKLIEVVQKFFDVSLSAAAQRITQLSLFEGAIVLTSENRTCFNYRTKNFNEQRYTLHKKDMPYGKILYVLVAETYIHLI